MPVGGLVTGLIGAINARKEGKKQKEQLLGVRDLYRDLPLSEYEDLVAPQLTSAGQLTPEIYDAIIRGEAPEIQEDPSLREAQLRGLLGMEQISREGLPLQDRLRAQDAQRSVAGELERADEGILRNLAQRGRAGGGTELAARLATQGRAAETARGMGSDLAQQSIQNRLMALQAAPGMAGQIRGQDASTAAQNAAMQQRYNEFVSGLQTQAAQNAAQQRAQVQQMNLANAQRIQDTNALSQYQAAQDRNRLQDLLFQQRYQKAGGQAGAMGSLGQLATDREANRQEALNKVGGSIDAIFGQALQAKKDSAQTGGGGPSPLKT